MHCHLSTVLYTSFMQMTLALARHQVLGCCMQHTAAEDIMCTSLTQIERLANLLGKENGGVHLGRECMVISVAALGNKPHHAFPLLALSSCKDSNPDQQKLCITMVRPISED